MEHWIFSDVLIKFFEKEEWADAFINGELYINEAKKFILSDDNYRGDEFEGCQVTCFKDVIYMELENTKTEEKIVLPLTPKTPIKQSFQGADKVPIFCASGFNSKNTVRINNKYKMNSEYIAHMKQFGTFAVFFSRKELLDKLDIYGKKNKLSLLSGDVCYQEYDTSIKHFETDKEQYEQFFCKYISEDRDYNKQNEWRLILCDTSLIDDKNDHIVINVGTLKYAKKINVDFLEKAIITFNKE